MAPTKRSRKAKSAPKTKRTAQLGRDEFDMQRITDFPIRCRLLREQYSDPRSRLSELSAFVVACDLDPLLADYAEARVGSTADVSYTNVRKHTLERCQAIQSVCVLKDGTLVVGNRDACLLHVFPRYGPAYKFRTTAKGGDHLLQPHALAAVQLPDGSDGVAVSAGRYGGVCVYDTRGKLLQCVNDTYATMAIATDSCGRLVTAKRHDPRGHHSITRHECGRDDEPVSEDRNAVSLIVCGDSNVCGLRGLAFGGRYMALCSYDTCRRYIHGMPEMCDPDIPRTGNSAKCCDAHSRRSFRDLPFALDAVGRLVTIDMSHKPVGRAAPVLRIHPAPDAPAGEAVREILLLPTRAEFKLPLAMAIDYRGHVFTVDGSHVVREYY